METWLRILPIAAITYGLRAIPLLAAWRTDHPLVQRFLRYVPPAILAALVVPDLLVAHGELRGGGRLWAGLFAAAVAWKTGNMTLTIVAGMAFYACWQWQFA